MLADDKVIYGNATVITENKNTGVTFFVNSREREWYDHNNDEYSELPTLKDNTFGILHSIDSIFRPWQSVKMIGAVIPKDFRSKWDLEIGKSVDKLPYVLNKFQDTDIFIHDSLHTYQNMMFEFNIAFKKIKKNGIIISDDVLGNDAFHNFVTENKLKNFIIKVDEGVGLGIIIKT